MFDDLFLKSRLPVIGPWLNKRAILRGSSGGGARSAKWLVKAMQEHPQGPNHALILERMRLLKDRFSRTVICRHWAETRDVHLRQLIIEEKWVANNPLYTRILTALLTERHDKITGEPPDDASPYVEQETADASEMINILLKARDDKDPVIQAGARIALRERIGQGQAWMTWLRQRDKTLGAILMEIGKAAERPASARVLSRLKLGRAEDLEQLHTADAGEVRFLLEACADKDAAISAPVPAVLRKLTRPAAHDKLFEHALFWDEGAGHPQAVEALVEGLAAGKVQLTGVPDIQLAGWLFLHGTWEEYDALDFDRRLLGEFYATAPKPLQKAISTKIRETGRVELLTVIGGSTDLRHRAGELREDEAQFIITMLISKKQWEPLWKMAFEVSLRQSVRAVKALRKTKQWQPPEADQQIFERLAALVDEVDVLKPKRVGELLPLALPRATAAVRGRVNSVALSPARPLVAIGTNDGRAALWNFQTGEIEQRWKFRKVVGRVAFTANDLFVCSEGKAAGKPSTLRIFQADGMVSVVEHEHMITGISAAGGSRIAISRRDGVQLFDTATLEELSFRGYDEFWCRNVQVAPDGRSALLLHERLSVAELPELNITAGIPFRVRGSILACAAYAPGGKEYLLGTNMGSVVIAKRTLGDLVAETRDLFKFTNVAGIETIDALNLVVTGGGNKIAFYDWDARKKVGEFDTGPSQLLSLHVSANGSFIAAGHKDDTMSFWDMRVSDIPRMFVAPFARTTPRQLGAVRGLREQGAPDELHASLDYLECILQHRFRFDIEVGELQSIRAGEFDIELD